MNLNKDGSKAVPKVSIVIINWNNYEDTKECIESLEQTKYSNKEIIIVDNGSTDDSYHKLKKRFAQHRIISNKENLGFSAGCNLGIRYALENSADYVLLLNNDTIVDNYAIAELVNGITQNEEIGLIGGKIFYFNEMNKIWSAGGGIKRFTKKTFQFGEKQFNNKKYNSEREVDFLSGCCLLIRREVFEKIGLLDPDYFMYYEDVDFCLRAKNFYKIMYLPQAVIWHKVSNTSKKSFRDYYRMKNHILLLKKRYSFNLILITIIGIYIFTERIVRILVRKYWYRDSEKFSNRISSLIKGFKEGLVYNGSKA